MDGRAPEQAPEKVIVLVVEDEPILRMMAVDLVEDSGFGAIEAASADDAVVILENRADVRIVFSDIDMPGRLNGMTLAACIRRRWPPIGIILTSGHFCVEDVDLPVLGAFFPKPYDPHEVAAALHRMA